MTSAPSATAGLAARAVVGLALLAAPAWVLAVAGDAVAHRGAPRPELQDAEVVEHGMSELRAHGTTLLRACNHLPNLIYLRDELHCR